MEITGEIKLHAYYASYVSLVPRPPPQLLSLAVRKAGGSHIHEVDGRTLRDFFTRCEKKAVEWSLGPRLHAVMHWKKKVGMVMVIRCVGTYGELIPKAFAPLLQEKLGAWGERACISILCLYLSSVLTIYGNTLHFTSCVRMPLLICQCTFQHYHIHNTCDRHGSEHVH